jgi:hypothetical protein
MTRTFARALVVLAACWALGCGGGLSSDGGQSGTGIAAIRGTVVAVTGAAPDVADIHVSVAATDLTTRTDDSGRFELRGNLSGPAELRFERQRDGLLAAADIVIPAGGVLELEEIVLDSDTGEAHPTRQVVDFEGIVEMSDCAGGTIRVKSTDDEATATAFIIEVASATISRGSVRLACGDVQVGAKAQVRGDTPDGTTLVNAVVVLEDDQNEHDDHTVKMEGAIVE